MKKKMMFYFIKKIYVCVYIALVLKVQITLII